MTATAAGGTRIGLDLDNTIVCYDAVFATLAVEHGLLSERDDTSSKRAVRDALRRAGREDDWTALQGEAYGSRMDEAEPFAGVLEFVANCRERGLDLCIVSHRTRRPYAGPDHDLHAAAAGWLERHGLVGTGVRVFLEVDRESKAERIARLRCTHFVDDLADFLCSPTFPRETSRMHFDPSGRHGSRSCERASGPLRCVDSWTEVGDLLLTAEERS